MKINSVRHDCCIGVIYKGDEYVVGTLKKLIPFLFRSFYNLLIFKLKKIGGIKMGSQLATLYVIIGITDDFSAICTKFLCRSHGCKDGGLAACTG